MTACLVLLYFNVKLSIISPALRVALSIAAILAPCSPALLSNKILKHFSKVMRVKLPIPQPLGFHARPATYVSIVARQYENMDLFMIVDEEKFNAKSVMSLLQAGGTISDKGYQNVFFEGNKRVVEDIKLLAKHNYCEESDIPSKLSYLRDFTNSA